MDPVSAWRRIRYRDAPESPSHAITSAWLPPSDRRNS